MARHLERVAYDHLNARQQESYNFQKISAVLADYGYVTIRLSDDWKGADFLAQHISGRTLRVQLKSRLMFDKRYSRKDLWVTFCRKDEWYLFPHDEVLRIVLKRTTIGRTASWRLRGKYSFPTVSKTLKEILSPYLVSQA